MLHYGSAIPSAVAYFTAESRTEDARHRVQNEHGSANVTHASRSSIYETKARLQERLNMTYPATILVSPERGSFPMHLLSLTFPACIWQKPIIRTAQLKALSLRPGAM